MNPLIDDILGQPGSLEQVIANHMGPGKEALARAAAEIRHARQVIFSGMGSSLFASIPAVSMLNLHRRPAAAIEAAELLYYHRGFGRDTLAVLISRSGETVEVVKLISLLRAQGVRIIGVTNVDESTLATEADIAIHVRSAPDRLVALRTYTATAATLLLLASEAAHRSAEPLKELPSLMQSTIERELDRDEAPWPQNTRIYLLGRGASLGSAQEGALLFHETARSSATPMSCAQFRHGPVEAVASDLRAFVFASQPETRELDQRFGEDLDTLGATVRVLAYPEVPSPWAAVLEIIPVQVAAVRLAESRGVPPASFQFAPMVTVDETGFANPATGQ